MSSFLRIRTVIKNSHDIHVSIFNTESPKWLLFLHLMCAWVGVGRCNTTVLSSYIMNRLHNSRCHWRTRSDTVVVEAVILTHSVAATISSIQYVSLCGLRPVSVLSSTTSPTRVFNSCHICFPSLPASSLLTQEIVCIYDVSYILWVLWILEGSRWGRSEIEKWGV